MQALALATTGDFLCCSLLLNGFDRLANESEQVRLEVKGVWVPFAQDDAIAWCKLHGGRAMRGKVDVKRCCELGCRAVRDVM